MAANTAAKIAEELEAQLDEYPDERGEILIEAAGQWRRAGEHDRAIALMTDAIALGGEDGGYARVELASLLFDLGRDDEATAQLDTLRHSKLNEAGPYHLAGELLEERGERQQALRWFNMAISRFTDDEMAMRDEAFSDQLAARAQRPVLVRVRRQVQEMLRPPQPQVTRVSLSGLVTE